MKLLWRAKMSTVQYGGEEVEEGAVYNVTLRRVQIQQAANKGARWLGIEEDQFSSVDTLNEYETYKIRTIKAGTLEKLVENLLTASGDNDFSYIIVFLSTYRAFASTKEVLELLLDKYGNLETLRCEEVESQNFSESSEELRTTIASISQVWLEQCSEDFREPPNYPCLLKLLDYLKRNMPGSDPERRAQNLLETFQSQEMENNYGFHNSSLYNHNDEEELVITCSEDLEFFFFPEDFVAEQLTYMDATLFKRVVPHHCLGCIWSRRNKEENKHLVPTIKATISQFNAVTKCVISTILKSKAVKPQQRAKIIEKWIHIACPEFQDEHKERRVSFLNVSISEEELICGSCGPKPCKISFQECRILKNFSSLRAIISALQSNSIYRLKKSWACVAKDVMQMFHELSVIFSNHDNYLTTRELLMKERTPSFAALDSTVKEYHKRTVRQLHFQKDMRPMQGTVPYLGTFLTDLVMLDTAHQDYIEGGLINFEKRRREFEVIAQIKWLQSACESYCMTPDAKFIQWFRKQQHLTEEESFNLSREIEAAPDTTTESPKPRKSMVKRFSLLFVSTEMASQSTPFRGQLRFTSGGSSTENTDLASDSSSEEVFIPVKGSVEEVSQKKVSESSESSSLKVSCCSTDISSEVSSLIAVPPLSFKRVSIAISKSSVSNAIDKSSLSDAINEYSNAVSKDSLSSSSDQSSLSSSSDQSFLSNYSDQSSNAIKCPVFSSSNESFLSAYRDQSLLSSYSNQHSNAIKCSLSSASDQSPLLSNQSSNTIKCPVSKAINECTPSSSSDQSSLSNAIKKHSVSVTPITSKVLPPVYNRQNEDMCIIRISIENNNGNMYKSILLTSQDKTRAVIQRAMLKHNLEPDTAEDYELVQIISEAKELVLPANANVFYAMNSHVNFDFILRKKASVNGQVKMRCYSPKLSRGAKWGRWTNRPSNIAL